MIEWVMHVPVLSTAHLTFETANTEIKDNRGPGGLYTVPFAEGFIVFSSDSGEDLVGDPEIPPDMLTCMKWAGKHGFEWVRFDSAGDVVEELPTYEW